MKILELQIERGIELPSDYLEFVAGIDAGEDYCFNEYPDEYPEFKEGAGHFLTKSYFVKTLKCQE